MRRYSEEEVLAILYLAGIYGEENALEAYKEFTDSVYNIPYRDISICLSSWVQAKKLQGAQYELSE